MACQTRPLLHAAILFALALLIPRALPAKDTWIEVRSPNFTVISNAGEGSARKIAEHFEEFRELVQNAFPKMRVDLGKTLIIFALKNEDSMKVFLPAFWEVKGHTHPAGIYQPGEDKHFVAVRTDIEGPNPYEVVYHEYTHALMDLNYRGLPLWLGEGLAEFLGNSDLGDKEVRIGIASGYQLQVLQQNRLIPIETLLQVEHNSPYYNEQNHTSVFYAESWTMVHYLMLDPDARKRNLLSNFFTNWDASGDQVEAAQKTFGDLKKFAATMDAYSRQDSFYVSTFKITLHVDPKSYPSRVLASAEADAARGEFYVHTQRPKEAQTALDAALQEDPNLPAVHEGLGELALSRQDLDTAETEFARAIKLNSTNFISYFFDARSYMRHGMVSFEDYSGVVAALEKSISMNPNFAPAYSTLASVYATRPETHQKALAAGRKAVLLEPGNLSYAVAYGYVLLHLEHTADAKTLAARIQAAAKTPAEQSQALQFSQAVTSREAYDQQRIADAAKKDHPEPSVYKGTTHVPTKDITITPQNAPPSSDPNTPSQIGANPTRTGPRDYSLEGKITAVDCAAGGEGKVTLTVSSVLMKFHYVDLSKVQVTSVAKTANGAAPACTAWKGQKAKITFEPTQKEDYDGELTAIQFF
jgi:tetratricopeptide (TPR) repeat protein